MSYREEFKSVELLLKSDLDTRGVDAFCLALIKTERQMRKLFTHLIYQYPDIQRKGYSAVKNTLFENRNVYFDGFVNGFNTIFPIKISDLIGKEYDRLHSAIKESTKNRNKIFHGQLTNKKLTRSELVQMIDDLSKWCELLSKGSSREIGYDGFGRNSLKVSKMNIIERFEIQLTSLEDYKEFILKYMAR